MKWAEKEERSVSGTHLKGDEYSGDEMRKIPQIGEPGDLGNQGVRASDALFFKKTFEFEERQNFCHRRFTQVGIMHSSQKIIVF